MLKRLLLFACLMLITTRFAFSQDQNEGWPIVERCVPEPTPPPAGWTYPGVFLATGWAGLHGIRSDLEMPYVIVFTNYFLNTEWKSVDHALSPDRRWLVTVDETSDFSYGEARPISVQVHAIHIYSTTEQGRDLELPWDASYVIESYMGNGRYHYFQQPYWWDNEHLVYTNQGSKGMWEDETKLVLINPFTGQISDLPTNFQDAAPILLPHFLAALSPDKTRLLFEPFTSPFFLLYDTETQIPLLANFAEDVRWQGSPTWKPNSTQFIIRHEEDDYGYSIYIHDKDGNPIELIYQFDKNFPNLHYLLENAWSPDGRYFVMYSIETADKQNLFVADSLERQIIDLCTEGGLNVSWSPDGTMLAFSADSEGNNPIRILDLNQWEAYTVAYHEGAIIGWRQGD